MPGNAVLVNFSGGETSPKSRGRFDLPWYPTSAKKMQNFIAEISGPARFRPGFQTVRQTRGGAVPRLVTFQINNDLAYELEFTPGFMRAYRNEDLITLPAQTITGITNASPAVITVAATTGMTNGVEIILKSIVGMPQLNGKQVKLAGSVGSTFQLIDPVTGANIDTTALPAYASGGTASPIYEIVSPYSALDLPSIQWAPDGITGTMYIVCPTQPPQKLIVAGNDTFTLGTFSRTNDPFSGGATETIDYVFRSSHSDAGLAVPAGVTVVALVGGSVINATILYTFSGLVAMTQLNTEKYILQDATIYPGFLDGGPFTEPTFYLRNLDGTDVDSSTWTAYGSRSNGGIVTAAVENPISVAFYEGRLGYGGTNQRPACLFLSRAPDSSGNSRYDDFTGGSAADFACFFQLAPVSGSSDYIAWLRGGPDYLFAGSFGGPFRISGSGLDIPITPTSINVRQFDSAGCEETMAAGLAQMFFVNRGGTTVRAIKVINPYLATFESADMCLNAEQIPTESPIQRVVLSHGRPDVLWAYRADGILCGLSVHITVQNSDVLTGWHKHKLAGGAKVVDLAVQQRSTSIDQVWVATQRVLNGVMRCYIEVMADDVVFPDREDFFTGKNNATADLVRFNNALYRLQEDYVHLDAAATYDGSLRGVTAGATLTPGAATGTAVTLTASQAVFVAGDVGSEIWKKPNGATGLGGGRGLITTVTDSTHVVVNIDGSGVAFDSTAVVAAGDWYIAVKTIYGLGHLEGTTPSVVADGAVLADGGISDDTFPIFTVLNASITLPQNQAVVHVGLPYVGILETHNLEMGGRSGPAQSKPRDIVEMNIRFLNSLGVEFGTDLYKMQKIEQRLSDATMDRPAPPFSGIRKLHYEDGSSGLDDVKREKNVVVCQRLPLPAVVQFVDISYDTTDEGNGGPG